MKTILFITYQLPYPPVSGATSKSWGVLKHLAEHHRVVLGAFLKGKDSAYGVQMQSHVSLADCHLEPIDIPRTPSNLVKSYRAGLPLNVYRNLSLSFRNWVERKAPSCDLIFVDHFEMFQYVPASFTGRVILHEHNAEHVIWRRVAKLHRPPRKWAVQMEAKRVATYERTICLAADRVLAAPNDQIELAELGVPMERFALTYHLGDDQLINQPDLRFRDTRPVLLFIGTLSWDANSDGLRWFLKEVWPLILAQHEDIQFRVIGRGANEELVSLCEAGERVTMGGFVKDLETEYSRARAFICPLRFGSGTMVKVINALSRGLPVASTSIGAEGLPHPEGFMEVADEPEALAASVIKLMTDEAAWIQRARAGREAARTELSWERVLKEIDDVIDGPTA